MASKKLDISSVEKTTEDGTEYLLLKLTNQNTEAKSYVNFSSVNIVGVLTTMGFKNNTLENSK